MNNGVGRTYQHQQHRDGRATSSDVLHVLQERKVEQRFLGCLLRHRLRVCVCFTLMLPLSTYAQTNSFRPPHKYKIISFAQFKRAVLRGDEVSDSAIPFEYVAVAIKNATRWQCALKADKQPANSCSPNARLRLNRCQVNGTRALTFSRRPLVDYDESIQQYFGSKGMTEAPYLTLPIDLKHVIIQGDLILADVILDNAMTFEDVIFNGDVSFARAAIRRDVGLERVTFRGQSIFSGSLIEASISFRNCDFSHEFNFFQSRILTTGKVSLYGNAITVPIDFAGSDVLGTITFQGVDRALKITDKTYLNQINASGSSAGRINVKYVEFQDSLYLDRGRWRTVDFAESWKGYHRPIRFHGFNDFRETVFDRADFAGAEFDGEADFTDTSFERSITFDRVSFRMPARLRWAQIAGKMGQREPRFWQRGSATETDKQTLDELERNFKRNNDLESENECHFVRRVLTDGKRWQWAFLGYELHILNPLLSLTAVLIAFMVVNWILFANESVAGGTFVPRFPRYVRLTVSLLTWWQPPKEYRMTGVGRAVLWAEIATIKLLMLDVVIALMATSPLLKELIPYFLPK